MKRLAGKVAIITGGASGLGKAAAKAMIAEGAQVVLADVDAANGQATATQLGKNAAFYKLDVTSEFAWKDVFDFTEAYFTRANVLINNAGIANPPTYLEDFTLAMWNQVLTVNLTGTMLGVKQAIRSMGNHGGSIVNVSSVLGAVGFPLAAAYSISKAGINELTKTAALEVAAKGQPISINSISPGWVDTGIIPEELKPSILENIPRKAMGKLSDISNLIIYLASDESNYALGSDFVIDGGFLAH